jgi:branched-chain amino acid transport system ATP-binding protein
VSKLILHTENVTQRFGGMTAVSKVSVDLYEGEIVGIIGPNGAGKTTFFNVLTGIYTPTEGKVFLDGDDITGKMPHEIAKLGMTRNFQNIRLFNNMTIIENIMTGIYCRKKANVLDSILHTKKHRREEKETEQEALKYLDIVSLGDCRYDMATSLPYGQQRKLEIGRALASNPKVLLLDEPAAGMNDQETMELADFILELRSIGYSIILIEHDMRLVMNVCDRIYVLNYGAQIAHGTPAEIKQNPEVITAYLGEED